jgi:hypothetical protein
MSATGRVPPVRLQGSAFPAGMSGRGGKRTLPRRWRIGPGSLPMFPVFNRCHGSFEQLANLGDRTFPRPIHLLVRVVVCIDRSRGDRCLAIVGQSDADLKTLERRIAVDVEVPRWCACPFGEQHCVGGLHASINRPIYFFVGAHFRKMRRPLNVRNGSLAARRLSRSAFLPRMAEAGGKRTLRHTPTDAARLQDHLRMMVTGAERVVPILAAVPLSSRTQP